MKKSLYVCTYKVPREKTDFGFKKNFGDAEVMKAFLTDLLELSSEIKSIKHLDKERLADTQMGRGVVFDLISNLALSELLSSL